MGPLLLLAIAFGWIIFALHKPAAGTVPEIARPVLATGIPLALIYLCFSGSQPMFRQTALLQPFLFLFAALFLVDFASRIPRARVPLLAIGFCAIGFAQWRQAAAVFDGHQGVGRTLTWIARNQPNRPLFWLRTHWFDDSTSLISPEQFQQVPAGSLLMTYVPWSFIREHPSVAAELERTPALHSEPTLYATDTLRAELLARGYNDFRTDPLFANARVVDIDKLRAALLAKPIEVASVTADSQSEDSAQPSNVFDRDVARKGGSAWISAATPMPHFLDIQFAQPFHTGGMRIVTPPTDRSTNRISRLVIEGSTASGSSRQLWKGEALERFAVIDAQWAASEFTSLKLTVLASTEPYGPTVQAVIEEIEFPGYQVVLPK